MDRERQRGEDPGTAPLGHASPSGDVDRFSAMWVSHAHRIHAYATRHVGAETAQEIVAETFLVAWRRLQDVPGDPLPWLIVVARNTIASGRRSQHRARTLEAELARLERAAAPVAAGPEAVVVDRVVMLRGLAGLTDVEREALLLVAWDGLTAAQAAAAAGCSTATFHVRLHRARRRLAGLVDETDLEDSAMSHPRPIRTSEEVSARQRLSWRSE